MTADATTSTPQKSGLFSFADRKIGAKIALGFSAVLAIMMTMSGLAYMSLDKIDATYARFRHRVHVDTIIADLGRDFMQLRGMVSEFALTGDEQRSDAIRKQTDIVAGDIKTALDEIHTHERVVKIKEVAEKFGAWSELGEKAATARRELDRLVKGVIDPVGMQMRQGADKMQAWAAGKEGAAAALLAGDVMKNLLQTRLDVNKTLARHDQGAADSANKYYDDLRAGLTAFGAQANTDDMRALADETGALAKQYYEAFQTAERDSREIGQLLDDKMLRIGEVLAANLQGIRESSAIDSRKIEGATETAISSSEHLSLALAAAGLLIGAALAWSIGRAISAPVKKMTAAMTSLAAGHLDIDVPARGARDEIGEMAGAVQVFKEAAIAKLRRDAEIEDERVRHQEEQRRAEEEAIRHERELVSTSIGAGLAKLSAKDLTYRMTDEVPQDYRRLQIDFNSAISQLEAALAVVASGAQAIGSGASQIAVAADDLSKRTEQQAASLEETAAALEEVTVTVKSSAEGAVHASDIVGTTKSEAERSGAIVRQAVDAMGRIEKSSQEIGQIIGVIDEIAFQTNLLALNAGVEAARAGDAGKGFAVVASEVRALAQRSAEAAKEIKGLVQASSTQVGQGVALVGQTGAALEKIVAQVAEIDKVVNDIANGAREQSTSLTEVNTAVGLMDQNTQKNAAMVEETTAASHNLRKETEELLRSVGGFRIDPQLAGKTSGAATGRFTPSATRPARKTVAGVSGASALRKPAAEVEQDSWEEF